MRPRPLGPDLLPLVLAWTEALHLPALARLALRWGQRWSRRRSSWSPVSRHDPCI